MDYIDPNPENQEIVEEVRKIRGFNNMHFNLPDGGYRKSYQSTLGKNVTKAVEAWGSYLPLWGAIDEFIRENPLNQEAIFAPFKRLEGRAMSAEEAGKILNDPEYKRQKAESAILLCPLYVFLRKKGFTIKEITGFDPR